MASSWSSSLKIEIIGTGEQAGTWGTTTNDNFRYALEQAIVGSTNVTFSGSDVDLTLTDSNASQTARFLRLNLTGSSGGARNLYLSTGANVQKTYIINNGLADTVTVQNKISTPSGTSIAIPAGKTMWIYNTGTNVVEVVSHLGSLTLGTALPIASGGTGGTTNSAARTNLGATTVGSNLFTLSNPAAITFLRVNADNSVSTLDAATFRTAIGAGSVTSVGGTGTVNGLTLTGTVTSSGNLTLGGTLSNVNLASAVTGTLPVSNGGTGQTSLTANNVILGNGTSAVGFVAPGANGNVLTSNGTTWTSASAFVSGMIIMWSGSIASIPSGWVLCNGSNGTPDLRDRFIVGAGSSYAVAATGGSKDAIVVSHTHTGTTASNGNHVHSVTGTSTSPIGAYGGGGTNMGNYTTSNTSSAGAHTHTFTTDSTGSSGTNANLPPYYALAFIMKT